MTNLTVTAKSKISISQDPFNADPGAIQDPANPSMLLPVMDIYSAQTWVEIGGVTSLGTWGAKGKDVNTVFLSDGYTRRLKGSIDSGTVEVVVARDSFDVGQIAAKAAAANWNTYLFKVELNDAPTSDGTNSTFYFRASVMSAENKYEGADQIIETTYSLGITGQIYEVPADVTITFSPVAGALPGATSGSAYTETIAATGGIGPVSYGVTSGALPSGITLNAVTGVLSGTHTGTASFASTIKATFAGAGEDTADYTLAVS